MHANLNCALPATGWRGSGAGAAALASYHKSVSVAHYVQHAVNAGISHAMPGQARTQWPQRKSQLQRQILDLLYARPRAISLTGLANRPTNRICCQYLHNKYNTYQ